MRFIVIALLLHLPLLLMRWRVPAPASFTPVVVTTTSPPPPPTRVRAAGGGGESKAYDLRATVAPTPAPVRGNVGRLPQIIDEVLGYPPELTDQEGLVKATLTFDADGRLHRRVESTSDYLRVLVHQALREAFRDRVPQRNLTLTCTFEFALVREANAKWDVRGRAPVVAGEHVSFYRERNLWRRVGFKATPGADGRMVMGASVEMMDAFESVFEAGRAQAETTDPLEKYRRDPEW